MDNKDIEDFAKKVTQIGNLAIELADKDPLRTQQLLDTTAFLHRDLFNKSNATVTMEELEDEYIRDSKQ